MQIISSNKKKRTNKPKSVRETHYVDNKEFLKAFIEFHAERKKAKEEGQPEPRVPNYIGSCFMKIAEKYSHHPSFINYPYREEMVSDATENCVMYAHDFDPNRGSNPFAYFSQVAWNAFIRRINKENKNKYITYKSHQMQSLYSGLSDGEFSSTGEDGSSSTHKPQELYENISSYIDDYERRVKEKRAEKKRRLAETKNNRKTEKIKK